MPAGISNLALTSEVNGYDYEIGKESPAFTILHKDGLEMTLPLLHMNHTNNDDDDNDNHRDRNNRNNGLTRIIPRNGDSGWKGHTDLCARKRISRSNDHLVLASLQNHQSNPLRKKHQSKSHENLGENDNKRSRDDRVLVNNNNNNQNRQAPMSLSTEDFNDVLNAKLRKIQEREDEQQGGGRRGGCRKNPPPPTTTTTTTTTSCPPRKPFITTVKTGEFLMPPPEVAALLGMAPNGAWIGGSFGEAADGAADAATDAAAAGTTTTLPPRSRFRPLVSLGRRPEVRHSSHNARCQAALKATVDFASSLVNYATTTGAAATAGGAAIAHEERSRRVNRFANANAETEYTKTPRALPKKLEPIEGMMNMLLSPGDQPLPFGNIMFDRRVIRGSTFASAPMLIDAEQSQAARQAEAKRKQIARKRVQSQAARSLMMRIGSPPPVPGRKHEPVQTELYLEELCDKPDESEVGTQTDYFLDRPATPLYCPGKVGQDAETQIGPGDLFDYDVEVQPILEVLVGKTIEQALIEVLEEEELAALREQQRRFLELRAAEKAEQQRLEEQERRLREEKCRRVKQHEEAMKTQQETEERVAAAVLLTGYIAELLPAVLEGLKMSGFLLDEIKADVEEGFMPWLMKEVKKEMGSMIESRELLMEIVREILENRAQTYTRLGEDYDGARDRAKSADEAAGDGDDVATPTGEGGEARDVDFVNYEPPVDADDVGNGDPTGNL